MSKNSFYNLICRVKSDIFYKIFPGKKYEKKSLYADFTPFDNLDGEQECIKALDWALKNPKITNIALAGPYGSGKSSVISSYCKLHPKCKAINISLATFDGAVWDKVHESQIENNSEENENINNKRNEKDNSNKIDTKELEEELEIGILKQLFYKIDADKIPLSRYRKLHHIKLDKYILGVFATLAVLCAMVYFLFPEKISFLIINYLNKIDWPFGACRLLGAFLTAILGISYVCRFVMTKFTIKQISVGDASIHGEEINKESILNKNMDEMLYFFEKTKYNVVFIEDLDRFNTTSIFVKLREINKILNQYEILKDRIVFVYAVKDDLFKKETDRTKFFDFLIPVIPVINSTNSGEIMRSFLGLGENKDEKREYKEHFVSDKFITLVSPFIGDMRVLISIVNEFWMYKNTLIKGLKDQLNDECLLALIIYKNLYPKDFALLEAETGDVKEAFNYKKQAIKMAQENLYKKRIQLERMQNDALKSIKELKIIILSALVKDDGFVTEISVDNKRYDRDELLDDSFSFEILKKGTLNVDYIIINSHYTKSLAPIKNLEESNDELKNLFLRYDACCAFKDQKQEEILKEFENIDRDIMRLKANSLQQLIENNPVDEVLPDSVRKNDLLVFFLRHGYINENYVDYINYFHPGSISKEELNFILSVRNHKSLEDFTFSIKHCDNVCDRLDDYEFEQQEVLNFDLLDYLLDSEINKDKLQQLISQLADRSLLSRSFIKSYTERNIKVEQFLQILCHESSHIWEDLEHDEQLSMETKDKYFKLIIKSCSIEDICKNNYKKAETDLGGIKEYFENDIDILAKISDISISQIKKLINALDIHFYKLDITQVDLEIIDFIIEGKYYVLNPNMMEAIFQIKKPECLDKLFCSNYHCIRELGCDAVLDYIYDNFSNYVQEFVLGIESNTEETKDDVEDIIERLFDISRDMCLEVIKKEHLVYWEELSSCLLGYEDKEKEEIWEYLLLSKRTKLSWDNYLLFHNVFGLTYSLFEFTNINMKALINEQSNSIPTDDNINELLIQKFSDDSFKLLISAYKVEKFTNKFAEFEESKLIILIDANYFGFTAERYIELKEFSYEMSERFALANKLEFFELIGECEINIDEVKNYLGKGILDEKEITTMLECISPDEMDEQLAQEMRNIDSKLPKKYVEAAWSVLKSEDKYQLLSNQLNVYTMDELARKFGELGGVYNQFAERTKHKYKLYADAGGFNLQLCCKLCKRGFLSSCSVEEDKQGKYIIGYVKKKPEQKQRVITSKIFADL